MITIARSLRSLAAGLLLATVAAPLAHAQTTVMSAPVGVMRERLPEGLSGLALPLIASDLAVGIVQANSATTIAFPAGDLDPRTVLSEGGKYYVEVVAGPLEGERLDVDVAATLSATDPTIGLALGPNTFSTLPALSDDALVGARVALRPHVTLASLQKMITPGLVGNDQHHPGDSVLILENEAFQAYSLRADGLTWSRHGSRLDFRDKVIPPDASVLLQIGSRQKRWIHTGLVRTNAFRKNLSAGFQSFATGFPVNLTTADIGAFVDPNAPAEINWTGSNAFVRADQIHRYFGEPDPLDVWYLRADGVTWRRLGADPRHPSAPVLGATDMTVLRRVNPNPSFAIQRPFGL
jgi:hypothetical protein